MLDSRHDGFKFFFNLYTGQWCALLGLSNLAKKLLCFPLSGDCFLLTRKSLSDQSGYNDFDNGTITGPGLFIIFTGAEPSDLWVADGCHKNGDM